MPEIQRFVVTQTRSVEVTANSMGDACDIGRAAFANGQNSAGGVKDGPEGVWGNTTSRIKIKRLEVDAL